MKKAEIGVGLENGKSIIYNLDNLTQHVAVLGTTGSGKTVMCKVLIEEALAQGIPVIAIDPKGDIGGLGITSKTFDFRPFSLNPEKTQSLYQSNFPDSDLMTKNKLIDVETKIFTPKSSIGIQISLIPDLSAPKEFKQQLEKDSSISSVLIEPLSESICQLAGISSNYEKAMSLISSIILHNWTLGLDLTIESLIKEIIKPPFDNLGTLSLEEFIKEKDRLKIASSVNLILSSPSKQAWNKGQEIDIEKMFEMNNLSIFDLRYSGVLEDKQYAVEQILQEIYRFLLHKGGSDNLKYILYIDEIAGLFPAPPSSPPCKKSLELLIRQARAFGLGIILATQNPGDIDYKVLGNIGTRFIGKLRTENDMNKVATATGVSLNTLKNALMSFKTGDFFFNNSVENKSQKVHSRWLYSYHSGPLNEKEIAWINNPETKPPMDSPLEIKPLKKSTKNAVTASYSTKVLKKLRIQTEKYSDKVQTLITESASGEYIPLLSVTVEPKSFKNKSFQSIGPYIFDLTNKINPADYALHSNVWKPLRNQYYKIINPKRSVKKTIYQIINQSQSNLKKKLYKSKVIDSIEESKDDLIKSNYDYMKDELTSASRILMEKSRIKEKRIEKVLMANDRRIGLAKSHLRIIKAGRLIRKIFGNKRLTDKTMRIRKMERTIRKLKNKRKLIKLRIKKNREKTREMIKNLESRLYQKSHTLTKSISYNPSRKDLIIHANILLFPAEKIRN